MMLHPFDIPSPAPPAGQRREDATLSFSRRALRIGKRIARHLDDRPDDIWLAMVWTVAVITWGALLFDKMGIW
jgi:hypothetical protein